MCAASQPLSLVFDDSPAPSRQPMEFRLLYSGEVLGASRNNTRADLKHEIRRSFHPQLRRLWQTNHSLQRLLKMTGVWHYDVNNPRDFELCNIGAPPDIDKADDFYRTLGAEVIEKQWERCGYHFWPLVTEEYCVRCALDILFLRPEEPGMIVKSGDIDGRLKTVFDALRIPKNLDEAGGKRPQDDESPFYCLLEDDKLISEIKVTTDQLLLLPSQRQLRANDAFLSIHVRLWPNRKSTYDWAFY